MQTKVLLLLFAASPLIAQTHPAHTTHTPVHHAASAGAGGCARLPELSPKIPALAPGSSCARPLYTITHHPAITLDYASPMLSPALHELLDQKPETFSLDYVDTKIGTGPLAQPHKWYTVHYTGYLVDGTKFDSSVDRGEPISFPYGAHKVVEGWDTGFEGMHVGGKRRLFVPYQLGYGEAAHGPIPPRSMLVFDLELIAQSDTQPVPPRSAAPHAPTPSPEPGAVKPSGADSTPPAQPSTPQPKK